MRAHIFCFVNLRIMYHLEKYPCIFYILFCDNGGSEQSLCKLLRNVNGYPYFRLFIIFYNKNMNL